MAFGLVRKVKLSTYKRKVLSRLWLSNKRLIQKRVKFFSSHPSKILYINSSGSNKLSLTGQIANEFLSQYGKTYPEQVVEEVQLWDEKLLKFSLSYVESKMKIDAGKENAEDRLKFDAVKLMTAQLKSANKVIISSPMWNYSIPYVLKQYIDCVVQPDLTFIDRVNGPVGLLTGRPLLLITSSSYDFSVEPMKSLDFQVPYLKAIFGLMGFQEFYHIYMLNTENIKREELLKDARLRIDEVIQKF